MGLTRVSCPLVKSVWQWYLADYPDRSFVATILHIIEFGASLGYIGPEFEQSCHNLKSAFERPHVVSNYIDSLCTLSRAQGPFSLPPLPHFRCSPLGTVLPKRKTKARVINHLSWPGLSSVNDGIPDSEGTIAYERFEQAVTTLREFGQGSLLAKLDLKDAYHHIPVCPQDWHLLGCRWNGHFFFFGVLIFGIKSAPYIFNLFAEALHWIIQRHIPAVIKHYLDDFLPIFRPSTPWHVADAAVTWIQELGTQLGLQFQESKTVRPCTALEFLGLELDSAKMEARLPMPKLRFLRELLMAWEFKRTCTLRELQELVGFLQFSSQVIPASRTFIRRLIDFSMSFTCPFTKRHVPAAARADLAWWSTYAESWNGVRLLQQARQTLHVHTDASGTKGIGGTFGVDWYASRVPHRLRHAHIQVKELYAVLQALLRWGERWRGCHVVFHVDNSAVVDAINNRTIRSSPTMSLMRHIVMIAACLDMSFSSSWLPSHENAIADAASRYQYKQLFTLAPSLNRQPSTTDPRLVGIKRTLRSRLGAPSSFGTASHLRHATPTAQGSASSLTSSSSTPVWPILMVPHCRLPGLR